MRKEEYFLKYNETSLMKNSLAIEDHLRNLESNYGKGHASCITKHAIILEEQLDESISHSSVVAPKKTSKFKEIRVEVITFRDRVEKGIDPVQAIQEIRDIRAKIEKLNPQFDTSKCKACRVDFSSHSKPSGSVIVSSKSRRKRKSVIIEKVKPVFQNNNVRKGRVGLLFKRDFLVPSVGLIRKKS